MQRARRWTPEQREQFWQAVRGRMAELQLDQEQVAHELNIHPSNLSRRLRSGVQDLPDEPMLQALMRVLQLEGERAHALLRLASVEPPPTASVSSSADAVVVLEGPQLRAPAGAPARSAKKAAPSFPLQSRLQSRRWLLPAAALLLVLAVFGVAALMRPGVVSPTASITQPADGAGVPLGWVDVVGTARSLAGAGPERLWLVEHQAGYYWPQQQAVLRNESWAARVRLGAGAADVGKRLDILLVLAPAAADSDFRAWLDQGAAIGDYPPMRGLPDGASILDRIAVTIQSD